MRPNHPLELETLEDRTAPAGLSLIGSAVAAPLVPAHVAPPVPPTSAFVGGLMGPTGTTSHTTTTVTPLSPAPIGAIAATTPEDVQRVARTYMGNPTIALVLPRTGAQPGN